MFSSKQQIKPCDRNFSNKIMHKYGTYSLKKRAFWYWMCILVMFSVLLLFLILYISKQLQQETYNGLHQTMDLYAKQLSGNMKTAEDCL